MGIENFVEMEGSRKLSWDIVTGRISGPRIWMGPWTDRIEFIENLIVDDTTGWLRPHVENPLCLPKTVEIEGVGNTDYVEINGRPTILYEFANVKIDYENFGYTIKFRSVFKTYNIPSLPADQNADGDVIFPDPVPVQIKCIEYTIVTPPIVVPTTLMELIYSTLGKVNNYKWDFSTASFGKFNIFGLLFIDPEQLLFEDCSGTIVLLPKMLMPSMILTLTFTVMDPNGEGTWNTVPTWDEEGQIFQWSDRPSGLPNYFIENSGGLGAIARILEGIGLDVNANLFSVEQMPEEDVAE